MRMRRMNLMQLAFAFGQRMRPYRQMLYWRRLRWVCMMIMSHSYKNDWLQKRSIITASVQGPLTAICRWHANSCSGVRGYACQAGNGSVWSRQEPPIVFNNACDVQKVQAERDLAASAAASASAAEASQTGDSGDEADAFAKSMRAKVQARSGGQSRAASGLAHVAEEQTEHDCGDMARLAGQQVCYFHGIIVTRFR